jgi:MFS family permease
VLALYLVPKLMTGNYWVAVGVGMIYGVTLAGFVPISALMPSLAPGNKGGAMALLNLGAGGAAFVGPAIVSLFLGPLGRDGVVLIFAGLYVVAAVLTLFLQLPRVSQDAIQQGKNLHEAAEPLSAPAT